MSSTARLGKRGRPVDFWACHARPGDTTAVEVAAGSELFVTRVGPLAGTPAAATLSITGTSKSSSTPLPDYAAKKRRVPLDAAGTVTSVGLPGLKSGAVWSLLLEGCSGGAVVAGGDGVAPSAVHVAGFLLHYKQPASSKKRRQLQNEVQNEPAAVETRVAEPPKTKVDRDKPLQKGDLVYRKGKACTVMRVCYETDPPHFVVRISDTGDEVGTERDRLSRVPPSPKGESVVAARPPPVVEQPKVVQPAYNPLKPAAAAYNPLKPAAAGARSDATASSSSTKQAPDKAAAAPKIKVNGFTCEEKRAGSGASAQVGRRATFRYNIRMPAVSKTKPESTVERGEISCQLGKGEVTDGWTDGAVDMEEVLASWGKALEGMKVGGLRRVHIAAKQGFKDGGGEVVPRGKDFFFDVDLKKVS
eukprot:TRINITY_DN26029_c0_g3_i1.p1 TRINITY_DN26029_c0_g3~~TRINITY_DN26029_c0_g3_i1.p1  ORF type:complete len:417 (-),score=94.50 TRINITY_DN26029_c0_g3_i1:80-1330(-)